VEVFNTEFVKLIKTKHSGLNQKQTALLKSAELNTIKMARYRLRKKFDIDQQVDLYDYLRTL